MIRIRCPSSDSHRSSRPRIANPTSSSLVPSPRARARTTDTPTPTDTDISPTDIDIPIDPNHDTPTISAHTSHGTVTQRSTTLRPRSRRGRRGTSHAPIPVR